MKKCIKQVHSKSNKILFVFEGEKTESQITNNLTNHFVNEYTNVQCAFCSDVYQLYDKLFNDQDLDTFAILQDRPQNKNILKNYKRTDFAEIYMFFDYDGHAPKANDDKIKDLLIFFDQETEYGKLFISYPMVEAIKHISKNNNFQELKVKAKENIKYKNLVDQECPNYLKDLTCLNFQNWLIIIDNHLKKMNLIVNGKYKIPSSYISQHSIFVNQIIKYLNVDSTVAVLSGFPIFIFDYYGHDKIIKFLSEKNKN